MANAQSQGKTNAAQNGHFSRRRTLSLTALLLAAFVSFGPTPFSGRASAQVSPNGESPISTNPGRSLSPLADPVLDVGAELKANRTTKWSEGDSKLLLMEGDFTFTMGSYGFRADRALVRIDNEKQPGRNIRHLSIYLDQAKTLRGRGPVSAEGPRLLVTGSTTGNIDLMTNSMNDGHPNDGFVLEGNGRIAQYFTALNSPLAAVPPGPPIDNAQTRAVREARRSEIEAERQAGNTDHFRDQAAKAAAAIPGATQEDVDRAVANAMGESGQVEDGSSLLPADTKLAPIPKDRAPKTAKGDSKIKDSDRIIASNGVVAFSADRIVFEQSNGEGTLVLMGHVHILYQAPDKKPGASLTAERAVIFVKTDKFAGFADKKASASDIKGVYLEDNVIASYDQYTVRAPRVYYDLVSNKAVVLDAVFFAWDPKYQVPIYIRAEKLRQESVNTWSAQRATMTTSEFGVPHFSIAAKQLTIEQDKNTPGIAGVGFEAKGIQAKAGKTPIFYWPSASGSAGDIPLRRVSPQFSNHDGLAVKTTWDAFGLLGRESPAGVEALARIDYLGERGGGLGLMLDYERPTMYGTFDTYFVAHDEGEDRIGGREQIHPGGDDRGYFSLRHRQLLPDNWEISVEGAYVSDHTFLEEFFRSEADASKPYETSFYVKKQENDWAFTALMKYDIIDFLPQTNGAFDQPYSVDKLPELAFYDIGKSLFGDHFTYYTENRVTSMHVHKQDGKLSDRGFNNEQVQVLYGLTGANPANTDYAQLPDARDITDDFVNRFDSRHELQAPFKLGFVDAVPFVAGRLTAYDDDFSGYAGNDENARLWGQTGIRLHTLVSQDFNDVEAQWLDIHRLRHIIEPNGEASVAGSTVPEGLLPIYDPEVEGISDGINLRGGVRNTLETQRGGVGRWRSVEWLVLNTDYIHQTQHRGSVDPIGQFLGYRPEYSVGGDYFHQDMMWMVSDTLATTGEANFDTEQGRLAMWRVGASLQHTPKFTTYADYTVIEFDTLPDIQPAGKTGFTSINGASQTLAFGFTYEMTTKYNIGAKYARDINASKDQSIDFTVVRKLPRWRLIFLVRYDELNNDFRGGVILIPDGVKTGRYRDPLTDARLPR